MALMPIVGFVYSCGVFSCRASAMTKPPHWRSFAKDREIAVVAKYDAVTNQIEQLKKKRDEYALEYKRIQMRCSQRRLFSLRKPAP